LLYGTSVQPISIAPFSSSDSYKAQYLQLFIILSIIQISNV